MTGMNRLNGLSLSSGNVLYCAVENGQVTQMILDNVTGDAMDYVLVLSATSNGSGIVSVGRIHDSAEPEPGQRNGQRRDRCF